MPIEKLDTNYNQDLPLLLSIFQGKIDELVKIELKNEDQDA